MGVWETFCYSFLGEKIRCLAPQLLVNLFWHLPLSLMAVIFYRYPARRLKVIGVTGTDGKTTVVSLVYHILKEAGLKTGMVSTVLAKIGDEEIKIGLHVTVPNPWLLQKLLRKMTDEEVEYLVLEVTSHGLDQHRLLGCNFQVGVITNVTHEHLDYHGTWEKYLAAKAKLFGGVKTAVLNRDDTSYESLLAEVQRHRGVGVQSYGIRNKADFTPKTFRFKTPLPGEYNQYNCLAAIAVTSLLGVPKETIEKAVRSFRGVTGRMEAIDGGQDLKVIIDFAHTPNALEQVLKTLHATRDTRQEKLIVVFGCAGLRDRQKRPMMGKIAAKYADFTVLTAEDPRKENVNQIIDEIAQGCLDGQAEEIEHAKFPQYKILDTKYFIRVPDRQEAIDFAIQKLAKKNDVVIICGKGHEGSMCFGRTEYPWSDHKAARQALRHKPRMKNTNLKT